MNFTNFIFRLRLHWRLPLFASPVTSIAFHPKSTASLVVTQTNNTFSVYEADEMSLSEWSKNNSCEKIETTLRSVQGAVCGVAFDPSSDCAMLLYGQGFIVYVDLTQSIPKQPKVVMSLTNRFNPDRMNGGNRVGGSGGKGGSGKAFGHTVHKRKSSTESDCDSNFAIIQRYRSLVHVSCVSGSQLVR